MSARIDAMVESGYGDWNPAGYIDVSEAQQMQRFAPDSSVPWWQSIIGYGITRAIDNRYGPPPNIAGNVAPGSFAGQNGLSYNQQPNNLRGAVPVAGTPGIVGGLGGSNMLLLAGAAVAAFLLLKKA